jgi:hypothetical protein
MPVTREQFGELALSFPGAAAGQHMDHPDFRAHGRIFATLDSPSDGWAMVKLSPDEQQRWTEQHPSVLKPARGAWGLAGCTHVELVGVDATQVKQLLMLAWLASVPNKRARRG